MKNSWLTFCPRTGYTRRVADQIAKRMDCEICDTEIDAGAAARRVEACVDIVRAGLAK